MPGIRVRPARSITWSTPAPTSTWSPVLTSAMRSPSITTVAPSTAGPWPSSNRAPVSASRVMVEPPIVGQHGSYEFDRFQVAPLAQDQVGTVQGTPVVVPEAEHSALAALGRRQHLDLLEPLPDAVPGELWCPGQALGHQAAQVEAECGPGSGRRPELQPS